MFDKSTIQCTYKHTHIPPVRLKWETEMEKKREKKTIRNSPTQRSAEVYLLNKYRNRGGRGDKEKQK